MSDKLQFPDNFLWGSATASYQVEGGIDNCDWAKAAEEEKVPICGSACDHYNKYEEDFDILRELGHKVHRISIEWSRIEPHEGEFNSEEIEHYKRVLIALHDRNIKPLVTLWHFTLPVWFSESGGWERKDAPEVFARYCNHVVEQLGDLCNNYATINEPLIFESAGYIGGSWPPFYKNALFKYIKVFLRLADGHNKAYELIKENNQNVEVGIVKHVRVFSSNSNLIYKLIARCVMYARVHMFMRLVHKKTDWIGLNYYRRQVLGEKRELQKTDIGWKIDPEGIYDALQYLSKYKKPIYVSEAGCADAKDRFRADYIRDTVKALHRALSDGVDLKGYCYWSLLDNYEWDKGFPMRFGLIEINYDTKERKIRPSAYVYKEIIESNSI